VDTLRHWEREGRISARRTRGGHRRYDEGEIRTFAASIDVNAANKRARDHGSELELPREVSSDESFELPSATRGEPLLDTPDAEWRSEREVEELKRSREIRPDAAEASRALQKEAEGRGERERLERLRQYGRARAFGAPALQQAQVNRDLLAFVTGSSLPAELDDASAYQLVGARVDQILQPWRDQDRRSRTIADLVQAGLLHASIKTFRWTSEDADEAKREVKAELQESVQEDWTRTEVDRFVDEILAEWADEDEDE
jgi:DNA-binding transcriptional MerR regulator